MIATITKRFTFVAERSHPSLPNYDRVSIEYEVELVLRGEMHPPSGFVVDHADITKAWEPLRELLDYRHLNVDVPEIGEPSTENLAVWMINKLLEHPMMRSGRKECLLHAVRIKESSTTWCEVFVTDLLNERTEHPYGPFAKPESRASGPFAKPGIASK